MYGRGLQKNLSQKCTYSSWESVHVLNKILFLLFNSNCIQRIPFLPESDIPLAEFQMKDAINLKYISFLFTTTECFSFLD